MGGLVARRLALLIAESNVAQVRVLRETHKLLSSEQGFSHTRWRSPGRALERPWCSGSPSPKAQYAGSGPTLFVFVIVQLNGGYVPSRVFVYSIEDCHNYVTLIASREFPTVHSRSMCAEVIDNL